MLKIAMLSTGEEVLHGDILDSNAAWLSRLFYQNGFALSKRSTVGDQLSALVEELLMLSFNNDVVIVNGGLGPTTDDLSAEAAAEAANEPLVLSQQWLTVMQDLYQRRGVAMPKSNEKQAMLPQSAQIIDNPVGTACGFCMQLNDAVFYFTPGVPSEFKRMTECEILPDLKKRYPDVSASQCSRLYTFGLSESGISDTLSQVQLPEGYELGYRSSLPFIEVKLFGPADELEVRVKLMQLVYKLLQSNVISVDKPLVAHLGHLLQEKSLTLALAEQSTCGYLTSWLQEDDVLEQQCSHAWVLTGAPIADQGDPLAATFALAAATREKCVADISLVTGRRQENQFCVALSTKAGEWGMTLEIARRYTRHEAHQVISAVAADLLRRYLENKPMFGEYAALTKHKQMFIPALSSVTK